MDFDFASSATVDSLDKVPENFRGAYAEVDGKFTIRPEVKFLTDAVSGLNGALRNERSISKTLKGQKDVASVLKEHLGFETVEEAKAKFDELTGIVTEKSKIDPAKIKADIEKAFQTKEVGYQGQVSKMQATLNKYLVTNSALGALSAAKGNPALLMPIIAAAVEVVADGEDYVVRVKDGQGDYRGNGAGGFMTIEDYVKELKASKDFGVAFQSETPSGGGGRGQRPAPGVVRDQQQRAAREDQSPADRIAAGLAARRGLRR